MSTTVQTESIAEAAPAEATPSGVPQPRLYRVIWRWHFYAGLIVAPVLFLMSLTGGIYVFKDEIETAAHRETLVVAPGDARKGPDEILAVVRRHNPALVPTRLVIAADPTRAVVVHGELKKKNEAHGGGEGHGRSAVAVDPYTGNVTGDLPDRSPFFSFILDVHRRLGAGTTGRIVVELATCWALILIITGLYLWWPKHGQPAGGVWYLRLTGSLYRVLRDVHSVPGFYLAVFALLIVFTGLFFTLGWGSGFRWVQDLTGTSTKEFFAAPPSQAVSSGSKLVSLDPVIALAQQRWPGRDLHVTLPKKATDAIAVNARNHTGPVSAGTLAVDRTTGEVLKLADYDDLPALAQVRMWAFPVHTGSVFGAPTKVLAVLVCLLLMGLAVTGVWMWWKRRPSGSTGFPSQPETNVPGWLIATILLLGVFLPAVGVSVLLILVGEWVWGRVRGVRAD